MDLDLGPEIAEFRSELRGWITSNAPDGLVGLTDWRIGPTTGGYQSPELARATTRPEYAEWERRLADARLICPHWPAEFGGQGMDGVRLAVLNEEFHQAALPRVRRGMGGVSLAVLTEESPRPALPRFGGGWGESWGGRSISFHGTPEKQAYFL